MAAGMIDQAKLIAFLNERAAAAGVTLSDDGGMLALYAAYAGLAERVKQGEFNYPPGEEPGPTVSRGR